MKYQLVSTAYDYEGSNDIYLWARDEKGEKKKIQVIGFEPYFYVPTGETLINPAIESQTPYNYPSIYDEEVDKITTKQPRHVGELRDQFTKHFESDIPYCRRFVLDIGLYSGFEIPDRKDMVFWNKIVPCDFYIEPLIVTCDIETFSKGVRFPKPTDSDAKVTVICFHDTKKEVYFSIAIDPKGKLSKTYKLAENHLVCIVKNEKSLFDKSIEYLNYIKPDVFTAWYVDFDKEYLDERAQILKKPLIWDGIDVFDSLIAYKHLYAKGSNKLADVVQMEELNVPNYEPFKHEFWETDLEKAILVNKSHVEACVKLNQKKKLIEFYHDLKRIAGMEDLNGALSHGLLVETLLLRRYHNKFVLPSKPDKFEKDNRKRRKSEKVGGKVFDPPFGIFEEVGVFDMSRYYPEMLISQNLSPEPHPDELGVVPQLTLDLIEERLRYDRALKKLTPGTTAYDELKFRRNSVKFITESIIGYFGHEPSRLYDLDIFNAVTKQGQRGLVFLQDKCKSDGHKFIYGDSVTGESIISIEDDSGCRDIKIEDLFIEYSFCGRLDGKDIAIPCEPIYTTSVTVKGMATTSEIKKIIRHKTNKQLYEVTTLSGKSLVVTSDHNLICWDGQNTEIHRPTFLKLDSVLLTMEDGCVAKEKVSSVKYKGRFGEYVYDLEVEGTHTFLANNIFVHNTDSTFIQIPKYKCKDYVNTLNTELKKFGKKENISRELSLKLDYWFKKVMFKKIRERVGGKWVERGAKKRYAGRVGFENSKDVDYLKIVGFEYIRRDTSIETKKLQPTIIDLILSDKETPEIKKEVSTLIKSEVSRIKSGIKSGEIPIENIVIPKTLSKSPSEYGREKDGVRIAIPDYARGALYCNEWFSSDIHAGDQVKMVYVNNVKGYPKTDVISYLSYEDIPVQIEVNIEKMIDRCIKGTISGLIELIGLNWNEIFHPHKSLFDKE